LFIFIFLPPVCLIFSLHHKPLNGHCWQLFEQGVCQNKQMQPFSI
jgi:hypothetical protein